jgi:hypothetical protein
LKYLTSSKNTKITEPASQARACSTTAKSAAYSLRVEKSHALFCPEIGLQNVHFSVHGVHQMNASGPFLVKVIVYKNCIDG